MERNNMKNLQKDFVPYELSLKMKQLGFDEPCMYYVDEQNNSFIYNFQTHPDEFIEWCGVTVISTPLYQQAFRWFRDNHGFYNQIHKGYGWEGIIRNFVNGDIEWNDGTYNSPEEAELACLIKLIEIVKNNE